MHVVHPYSANAKTLVGDYHTHGEYSGKALARATQKYRAAKGESYTRVLGTPSGEVKVKEF